MVVQSGFTEPGTARPWPAERIEYWPIERLIPYADNARLHSEADIDKLARLASPMGMDQPRAGRRGRGTDLPATDASARRQSWG